VKEGQESFDNIELRVKGNLPEVGYKCPFGPVSLMAERDVIFYIMKFISSDFNLPSSTLLIVHSMFPYHFDLASSS
jgi:hypothetical protein